MNERIKELAIKTLDKEGVIALRAFGHWALSNEQMEKFAELIIQECLGLLGSECEYGKSHIKQHFGVEE